MTMKDFIKTNKKSIDEAILKECPNCAPLNDNHRRDWILNYEPLYQWARAEGVRI